MIAYGIFAERQEDIGNITIIERRDLYIKCIPWFSFTYKGRTVWQKYISHCFSFYTPMYSIANMTESIGLR